jgi:hypothetical protein
MIRKESEYIIINYLEKQTDIELFECIERQGEFSKLALVVLRKRKLNNIDDKYSNRYTK